MKKNTIVLMCFLCFHFAAIAQSELLINLKQIQQKRLFLSEIKSITFTSTDFVLNLEDNPSQNLLINDIYNFRVETNSVVSNIDENLTNSISSISLFPNPANDLLTVRYELKINQKVDIEIFNLSGTSLISIQDDGHTGLNSLSIPLNKLQIAGVYFVKIKTKDRLETLKLIKY